MALLDEVRFALTRIDTPLSNSVEAEFGRYINAAILDLTNTTDIKAFTAAEADALQKEAVIAYALYSFEKDVNRKEKYKAAYDDLKTKMLMSSKYANVGGVADDSDQ
ncbi:MAG: hypothetical protein IKU36_06165 [Bacteroidales bacterium]|nr:hypothetical protein [Bacteroidales bacterium]